MSRWSIIPENKLDNVTIFVRLQLFSVTIKVVIVVCHSLSWTIFITVKVRILGLCAYRVHIECLFVNPYL